MIQIDELKVQFQELVAVDNLSLTIEEGSLYGLLGPNGAGKTTTISCVCGLLVPTAGTIQLAGIDVAKHPEEVRATVGLVPQKLALYLDLTVVQNLKVIGGLYGLSSTRLKDRIEWALSVAELTDRTASRVETLSGGMKRRLNLAASLLHDPKVVICDEPTTGVDPQSRNHLFDTIRKLNEEGRTVVYTSHYMEEVEALCQRVAIMDHGKVIAEDTLQGLMAGAKSLEDVFLELTGHALRDAS